MRNVNRLTEGGARQKPDKQSKGMKALKIPSNNHSGLHFWMFGLSLTADVRIIKFKTLLVRPNDLLESELKLLYRNRMPGSSAEHLNTQNAKGLVLPAEPFNFKK